MMNKLKETKTLGVIGNIIIIVSLFFTWVTVGSTSFEDIIQSAPLISGAYGKWALFLSILSLINIFSEDISPKFFKGLTSVKLTYISSIVQLIMIVMAIHNFFTLPKQNIYIKFGFGFYLMCIGVVCMLIFPILYKQDKPSA